MSVALRNHALVCNNGTESSKGDPLRKETYELLARLESLNFIGKTEARVIMNGVLQMLVADGFKRETLH